MAFRPALQVLLVTALMIPVRGVIDMIFGEDGYMDWKLPLTIGGVIASLWFLAVFVSSLVDLRREDRIATKGSPVFGATSFISGLYGGTAVFSLLIIAGLHNEGDPLWLQLLPLIFVGIAYYAWPRAIHCKDTYLYQRNRLGLKKTIPYAAVEAISVDHTGTTSVLGAGTAVEHTAQHIDAIAFQTLVSERSGKPVY